jgi:hypothetical protein
VHAARYAGRCESSTWGKFDNCETSSGGSSGGPVLGAGLTVVFGPDEDDSPCVDLCECRFFLDLCFSFLVTEISENAIVHPLDTNQVIMYEGHYLAFPAAFQHLPSCWIEGNDGTFDTRIMHSSTGLAGTWHYINGDRGAFMSRAHTHYPVPTATGTPAPGDPRSWRDSMVTAVRGLVIIDNATIAMFAWGSRSRHAQDDNPGATVASGGGGAIVRVLLRRWVIAGACSGLCLCHGDTVCFVCGLWLVAGTDLHPSGRSAQAGPSPASS